MLLRCDDKFDFISIAASRCCFVKRNLNSLQKYFKTTALIIMEKNSFKAVGTTIPLPAGWNGKNGVTSKVDLFCGKFATS